MKIALVDFVRKVWSFRYGVRTRAHRRGGGQTVQGFQHSDTGNTQFPLGSPCQLRSESREVADSKDLGGKDHPPPFAPFGSASFMQGVRVHGY